MFAVVGVVALVVGLGLVTLDNKTDITQPNPIVQEVKK